jgi:hypothetical protein
MKILYRIDSNGFYTEPVMVKDNEPSHPLLVEVKPPDGCYKAKWSGSSWTETATPAEIQAIKNPPRTEPDWWYLKELIAPLYRKYAPPTTAGASLTFDPIASFYLAAVDVELNSAMPRVENLQSRLTNLMKALGTKAAKEDVTELNKNLVKAGFAFQV